MKGKTVALGDASWANIINPTLIAAGISPDEVEYVVAGANRYQMVQEGKLDILFTWVAEIEQLIGQGFDFRYISGDEVLPINANSIITNLNIIKNDPDLIRKFNRAYSKGIYFVKCNPEAAADIVLAQFPSIKIPWKGAVGAMQGRVIQCFGYDEKYRQWVIEKGWGVHEKDKWSLIVEWALKTNVIAKEIPLDRIYTNEFLDLPWDRSQVEKDAKNYQFKVKPK
jgi:hypothetical protein